MNRLLIKQAIKFVIVGCIAVLVDSFTYYLLSKFFFVWFAKGISFLSGMFFSYILNKMWTFSNRERSYIIKVKFIILYATSLILNVLINDLVLNFTKSYLFAFLSSAAFCTLLNFAGQRWWVYKTSLTSNQ